MKIIAKGSETADGREPWLGRWQCPHCGRTVELEVGDELHQISDTSYDMNGTVGFLPNYRPAGRMLGFVWGETVGPVRCPTCDRAGAWRRAPADAKTGDRDTLAAAPADGASAATSDEVSSHASPLSDDASLPIGWDRFDRWDG